jgi:hypothetical protein
MGSRKDCKRDARVVMIAATRGESNFRVSTAMAVCLSDIAVPLEYRRYDKTVPRTQLTI